MALRIVTADERLSRAANKTTIALFGPTGVGKTTQLKRLAPSETVCIDLEAGMKSVQDWQGDSIPVRCFEDLVVLASLVGGPNPAAASEAFFSEQHYTHFAGKHPELVALLAAERAFAEMQISKLQLRLADIHKPTFLLNEQSLVRDADLIVLDEVSMVPSLIMIDNLREQLDSSALAAALTAPFWEDRILGQSEMTRLPIRCAWVATGNNPTFSNEMARRLVRIRLDAHTDHRRAVDALGLMLGNGTITPQMHEAGCIFRTLFRSAALDSIATTQFVRVGGATADTMSVRQIDARRRVARAMDALGGHGSPAGSAMWFVVGLEMSIREWSARQGWGGRPVPQPIAGGMLVAGLGILAMHFGLTPRSQAA